jgi:hypothetical protein
LSSDQKAAGDTASNVADNQVSSKTKSGSVTSDTGDSVKVEEVAKADAKASGGTTTKSDDTNNDVKDSSVTAYDDGGRSGNTEVSTPAD